MLLRKQLAEKERRIEILEVTSPHSLAPHLSMESWELTSVVFAIHKTFVNHGGILITG
jgi:hypothetical protein